MPSSSRFAIAVHTLAVLAYLQKRGVSRISSQQIARSVNTNAVVIRSLVRKLKAAGMVESKEGKDGGVSLSRPASKISLDEVFEAVEESEILCPNPNPALSDCPVSCAMKDLISKLFRDVDHAVSGVLKRQTLKNLVDRVP